MSPETRKRALQAAAKLAAVSLASCSNPPAPAETPTVELPPAGSAEALSNAADEPPATDRSEEKIARPANGESKKVTACRTKVDAIIKSMETPGKSAAENDTEFLDCCQTLAEFYSHSAGDRGHFEARMPCCNALQWQGSLACTPWGPPMPPLMPSFLREMV